MTGFEPVLPVWDTGVLPLDDIRVRSTSGGNRTLTGRLRGGCSTVELRRRESAPETAGGAFTTAIQLSENTRLPGAALSGDAGN